MNQKIKKYWNRIASVTYYHGTNSNFIESIKENGLNHETFFWNKEMFEKLVAYNVKSKGRNCFIDIKCSPYTSDNYEERELWMSFNKSLVENAFSKGILPEVLKYLLNGTGRFFHKEPFLSKNIQIGLLNSFLNLLDREYANLNKEELKFSYLKDNRLFLKKISEKTKLNESELKDYENSYTELWNEFINSHSVILHISKNANVLLEKFQMSLKNKLTKGIDIDIFDLLNSEQYFYSSCKKISQNVNFGNEIKIAELLVSLLEDTISLKGVIKPNDIIKYEHCRQQSI